VVRTARAEKQQPVIRDEDFDLEFTRFEEAFDYLGLDLPESIRRSVPSMSCVGSFLVENDAFGLSKDMDEKSFRRRLLNDE